MHIVSSMIHTHQRQHDFFLLQWIDMMKSIAGQLNNCVMVNKWKVLTVWRKKLRRSHYLWKYVKESGKEIEHFNTFFSFCLFQHRSKAQLYVWSLLCMFDRGLKNRYIYVLCSLYIDPHHKCCYFYSIRWNSISIALLRKHPILSTISSITFETAARSHLSTTILTTTSIVPSFSTESHYYGGLKEINFLSDCL
jgi:hypothetical protein